MKTNLLILISRFLDGGIDTVMIEYLRAFDPKKFKITLAIGIKMDELEVFYDRIPSHVQVVYLVKSPFLSSFRKKKIKQRLPIYQKLFDETILAPFRRSIIQSRLNSILKKNDTVIDFDCTFYSFLQKITIRKIAFFHFSFDESYKNNPRRIQRIGKKLESYDFIIVLTDQMRQEGILLFPKLKEKLIRIYNSFDTNKLRTLSKESFDDPKLNSDYLLAIERLEESQKDLTTLIHAFNILKKDYCISQKLFIIGEGKSRKQLETLTQNLNLEKEVLFLGFIANPYPWIANCKMLVHSSKFEGLPTVLIEALLLEKPIVSTDCPTGPREILAYGKAGMLTPVGDKKALADAILQLLQDPLLLDQIAGEAKKQEEIFKIENNISLLEKLCSKPPN